MPDQRTFAGAFSRAVEQACWEREVDQRGLADAIARIQYRARAHGPERDDLIRRAGRSWESRISAWKSGQRLPSSEADLRTALRVIAPGTLASDWLDLWQQARRQRREQPRGPGRGQPTAPAAGPGPAEGHHWRVSAGETSPGANTLFLFTGRVTAISAITAWLTDPDGPRVCVVTGDPGSGKSAVLSWFALQDVPGDRRRFHDQHDYPRLPEGAIAATVHARGRDLSDIVQDIARQVGVAARDIEGLARALAERGRKIVVLLDAADEAEGADRQLVPKLVLPVVRGWAGQPLRLLLGARQHIARRLPASVASVNLDDPRFVDDGDLRTYVTRVLSGPRTHAVGWEADGKRVARVAAAVARHAARSYLVAQLVAGAVVERGELPSPDQPFPHDVAEAMQYYLAALPLDQLEAEDLLRPLAFARGQGLPVHLWSALVGRLSGRSPDDAARAVADLFYGPLASLIEVSPPPELESSGPDPARYRLFHDALDDYVADTPAVFPSAAQPGQPRREALTAGLLAAVPVRADGARDWPAADPYIRRHIAAHAVGTSVLAELVHDALFLLCGDPRVIIPALRELTGHTAAVQAYQEFASLSGPATPLAERAAQLALAAAKTASGELGRRWDAAMRPFRATAPWWPVAARWRAVARHRVVRSHRDAVNQVLAVAVFGEVVVVSAGEDGILGLTSLAEADLGADRRREPEPDLPRGLDFSRPLRALGVTSLDNLPLVVVGDEDGRVHVVDLPEATVSHSTQADPGPAVTAICLGEADGPVVVVGRADGTMQARTIPALEPLGNPVPTDGTEVFAIVPVSVSEVVAATGSGLLWRWDPGDVAPSQCYDGAPRVTALASAVLRPPGLDLVTGHDDGAIRVWDRAGTAMIGQAKLTARYAVVVAGTVLDGHPLVLCGAENDEIYVLDIVDNKVWLTALTGHHDAVWDLTIIDLGEWPGLLGAGEDGGVHLWLLDSLASVGSDDTFSGHRWSFGCLEESATGLIALAVDYEGRFALLDALSGEPLGDSAVPPDSASVSSSAVRVVGQENYWAVGTEAGQVGVGVWPSLRLAGFPAPGLGHCGAFRGVGWDAHAADGLGRRAGLFLGSGRSAERSSSAVPPERPDQCRQHRLRL